LRRPLIAAQATVPGVAGFLCDRRAARVIGTLGLLIENGVALPTALAVNATFPEDIRDSYADRLGRRLRFNMARLWLIFHKGTIDTAGMTEVLQFKGRPVLAPVYDATGRVICNTAAPRHYRTS
jgi:hypothetical protein